MALISISYFNIVINQLQYMSVTIHVQIYKVNMLLITNCIV